MKKTLILLTLSACANFQTATFTEAEYESHVYEDLTGTRDELFIRSNAWLVNQFKDASSVIQHSDKDQGVIMGKYLMFGSTGVDVFGNGYDNRIFAVIDIRIKDNKARIEIKPQSSWTYDANEPKDKDYSKQQAIIDMKVLSESFHMALLEKEKDF